MGEPRRSNPPQAIGISAGRGFVSEEASPGMYRRDLERFRRRPKVGPSVSMIFRAAWRSIADQQSVPSSIPGPSHARWPHRQLGLRQDPGCFGPNFP